MKPKKNPVKQKPEVLQCDDLEIYLGDNGVTLSNGGCYDCGCATEIPLSLDQIDFLLNHLPTKRVELLTARVQKLEAEVLEAGNRLGDAKRDLNRAAGTTAL